MITAPGPAAADWSGPFRLWAAIAVRGWRRRSHYRAATLAGIFTNSVFGFVHAYVLIAVWGSSARAGGWHRQDALTYVWVSQGALMVIYLWGWYPIADRIRSGDIVIDLQRPVDPLLFWLSEDLGRAAYHMVFRFLPMYAVGVVAFGLDVPGPGASALLLLSLLLAVLVSFGLRLLTNLTAFWLFDHRGVGGLAAILWTFFSGMTVPLVLMPQWLHSIANATPFPSMIQAPVDVLLAASGRTAGSPAALLAGQAAWAALLLGACGAVIARARRGVVIQGG